MQGEVFLDGRVQLYPGDCLEILDQLPEASIDSVVCDPPYHLTSIVKRFGAENAAPAKVGKTGAYARASSGFMGQKWDGGDVAFRPETWAAVLRVLKPGGHLLAFSGTRTYHRMAVAIEDAGFEIRDQIGWAYGSGFPKSHDVAVAIDKASKGVPHGGRVSDSPNAGKFKTQATEGKRSDVDTGQHFGAGPGQFMLQQAGKYERDLVPEALEWQGWGTALKPAWEPIVLARKPLIGSVAANVLKHGTGGLNIDGCRIESVGGSLRSGEESQDRRYHDRGSTNFAAKPGPRGGDPSGRWPANLIHDGSEEVLACFPETQSGTGAVKRSSSAENNGNIGAAYGAESRPEGTEMVSYGDIGSAARFFYSSKADSDDRLGSKHPTVKPVDLIQYLVRLVTPVGGVCLDPFAGTGTTGEAAFREGMRAILIEREPEYQDDIRKRMSLVLGSNRERRQAAARSKAKAKADLGPLFSDNNA